jgi:hypothetical protein
MDGTGIHVVLLVVYYAALMGLAALSLHRLLLVRGARPTWPVWPPPAPGPGSHPWVTVQLPIYNERAVVERLVDAAVAMRWPRERLEIQLLDDSTDDTALVAAGIVARHRAAGTDICHLRGDRAGFKAGALQRGLAVAKGSLVAIFDADFVPPPNFLEQLTPHFTDPQVGLVQARWGHLNGGQNLLTHVQSLMLDGHFGVEQAGRQAAGSFFNFNGTAGIWRREAILDAGGWRSDTLTEDLDLSYRAQLRGWRFVYRHDLVAPAELPADMASFRSQQHRWTAGSAQTARLVLPRLWSAPLRWRVRLQGTAHLVGNVAYPLMVLLGFLMPVAPVAAVEVGLSPVGFLDAALWGAGLGGLTAFYVVAARRVGTRPWRALALLPALVALGAGMAVSNTRGVVGALRGTCTVFVRTPKQGDGFHARYRAALGRAPATEIALATWLVGGAGLLVLSGLYAAAVVPLTFAAGLTWVAAAWVKQVGRAARA